MQGGRAELFQFSPRKRLGGSSPARGMVPSVPWQPQLRRGFCYPSPAFRPSPVEEEEPKLANWCPTVLDLEPSCPWVIFFLDQILLLVPLTLGTGAMC